MTTYLDYTINADGLIADPGRFEAEPVYVPYFWTCIMDGNISDEFYDDDTPIAVFFPSEGEKVKFPELTHVDVVLVWQTNMGFVCHKIMTTKQYEALMSRMEEV